MSQGGLIVSNYASRPSRARGLKHRPKIAARLHWASRPSRARGLKLRLGRGGVGAVSRSRPSRARGLKLRRQPEAGVSVEVAPLAGAWIETINGKRTVTPEIVAPLAGAWIETKWHRDGHAGNGVAPLAGAWIETSA